MYEIVDTGYGMNVNGAEFASFEDWLECEISAGENAPLTEQVDKMRG